MSKLLFVCMLSAHLICCCFPPCSEVAATWKSASTLDLRAKKKDTCKMPEDVRAQLGKVHVLGAVVTKAKKKKK